MSKFTRSELKSLVKECLVELLSEGLASRPTLSEAPAPGRKHAVATSAPIPPRSKSSALNSVVFGSSTSKSQSAAPARAVAQEHSRSTATAIAESISGLTSDPIMSQIFADTAATTLQEQAQAESARPGSASTSELVGDPGSLFEGSSNWAALAFSDPIKRN